MSKERKFRIYFNRRGATATKAWIVDTGEGTRRQYFAKIVIAVPVYFYYNGKEPDWVNPIAWAVAMGKLKTIRKPEKIGMILE